MRVGDTHPIRVDIRIIAATNRDLEKAVERREFRQDLYYRLKGIAIHLPPLRDRLDDIPLLAYHFLGKYRGNRKAERIDPQALKALQAYKWPGNVRELEHIIEYALSMAEGRPDQDYGSSRRIPEPGGRSRGHSRELGERSFR